MIIEEVGRKEEEEEEECLNKIISNGRRNWWAWKMELVIEGGDVRRRRSGMAMRDDLQPLGEIRQAIIGSNIELNVENRPE